VSSGAKFEAAGWLRGVDLNHRPLGYENGGHSISAIESITPKV